MPLRGMCLPSEPSLESGLRNISRAAGPLAARVMVCSTHWILPQMTETTSIPEHVGGARACGGARPRELVGALRSPKYVRPT